MSCALAAPEVLGTAHEIAHVERHQCAAAVEELNASALRTVLRAGGGGVHRMQVLTQIAHRERHRCAAAE